MKVGKNPRLLKGHYKRKTCFSLHQRIKQKPWVYSGKCKHKRKRVQELPKVPVLQVKKPYSTDTIEILRHGLMFTDGERPLANKKRR